MNRNRARKGKRKLPDWGKSYKIQLLKEQRGLCWICLEPMTDGVDLPNSATFDHVLPVSKGGLDKKKNLLLAHKSCNSDRGNELSDNRISRERYLAFKRIYTAHKLRRESRTGVL